ncbi:hypothetical protein [Vibrio owensii]|uniref:hypothetical protein n=1 Tax=Vibrio owensii TaxID=696485 RepID=UPI003CE55B9C
MDTKEFEQTLEDSNVKRIQKDVENHNALSEVIKAGASVVIQIESVKDGDAHIGVMFSPAGKAGVPPLERELEEQAVNALGDVIQGAIEGLVPTLYQHGCDSVMASRPHLIKTISGKSLEEIIEGRSVDGVDVGDAIDSLERSE